MSDDGHWTFLGRNSDMIKAGGIWVSPAEVESVVIEHPDVLEVAVVGSRDDAGLETVVAFAVARQGRTIEAGAIEAHCRERMAAFKRPRRLVVVDELPKTATGKVQRFALAGPARRRAAGVRPRSRGRVTVDGAALDARFDPGAGAGPPLVFLHDGLGSIELWRRFPDAVRDGLGGPPTLVYSRRGYGRSDPADLPRPVTYMHDEADVVLPALLTRHHGDADATFRGWNDVWLDPAFRSWNIEDRLAGVTCPVTMVQSEADPYGTVAQLDAIAAGVRGPTRRVLVPGESHAPHLDSPEAVVGAVVEFLG